MRPQRDVNPQLSSQQRTTEARRLRDRYTWLNSFTDDELQQISFCETGAAMSAGETYFDISHPEMGPFVGREGQLIPEGGCLVAQKAVPAPLWNKLTSYPSRR